MLLKISSWGRMTLVSHPHIKHLHCPSPTLIRLRRNLSNTTHHFSRTRTRSHVLITRCMPTRVTFQNKEQDGEIPIQGKFQPRGNSNPGEIPTQDQLPRDPSGQSSSIGRQSRVQL